VDPGDASYLPEVTHSTGPARTPAPSIRAQTLRTALLVVPLVVATSCFRLSSTTRLVLSAPAGLPVEVCESIQEHDLEISAAIAIDWGDGSPLDESPVFWDDQLAICSSHTFATAGTYQGLVSVSPGTTGWNQRPLTINVSEADPNSIAASGTCTCHRAATLSASGVAAYLGSSPSGPNTYSWSFGDGTTQVSPQAQVRHTFPRRGTYEVTLTAVRPGYEIPRFSQHGSAVAQVTSTVTVGF
jgi:hypothetical protein